MLHVEHCFIVVLELAYFGEYVRNNWEVSSVVLEKDGEDHLDRSCEKWRSVTESQGGEEYPTYNKKKEG